MATATPALPSMNSIDSAATATPVLAEAGLLSADDNDERGVISTGDVANPATLLRTDDDDKLGMTSTYDVVDLVTMKTMLAEAGLLSADDDDECGVISADDAAKPATLLTTDDDDELDMISTDNVPNPATLLSTDDDDELGMISTYDADMVTMKTALAKTGPLSAGDDGELDVISTDNVAIGGPGSANANLSSSDDDVAIAGYAPAKHKFHCATCRKTFLTRNGLWLHKQTPTGCPPYSCPAEQLFRVEFDTMIEALQWKDAIEIDRYYSCSQSQKAQLREFCCVVRERNKSNKLYKRTKKVTSCTARYSSE